MRRTALVCIIAAATTLPALSSRSAAVSPYSFPQVALAAITPSEIQKSICLQRITDTTQPYESAVRSLCYVSRGPDPPPSPPPPPPPYEDAIYWEFTATLDPMTGQVTAALSPCTEWLPGAFAQRVDLVLQLDKAGGAGSGTITTTQDFTAPFDCADGTPVVGPLTLTPLAPSHDQDSDGCADWEELGTAQGSGGLRDPFNFWDFYDVPTGSPLARDKAVASADLGAVVGHYGATGDPSGNPLSPPPPAPAYHTAYDRGGTLGPNQWNLKPADGVISGGDIGSVVAQYGQTCIPAP